jgi:hypothetical protein
VPHQPPTPYAESLSGLIERVTFFNEENGYGVLKVKAKGHRDLVTVVGSLPSVSPGEWLTAQGRWVQDREFGLQFKAEMLTSTAPTTILWKLYSGPGGVTFGNPAQTNTTATFSVPGVYTLELSADDGIHAVAYDAVVITVTNFIKVSIAYAGTNLNLSWGGGLPPFVVEQAATVSAGTWSGVVTTSLQNASMPLTNRAAYFRIRGQ